MNNIDENGLNSNQRAKIKTRKTKIENGTWFPDELLSDWELYKRNISYYTEKSFENYYNELTDNGEKKRVLAGKDGYQLDHKYSRKQGFLNGIIPEVIGSIHNLEILWWKDNLIKSKDCSITKEKLFEDFINNIK